MAVYRDWDDLPQFENPVITIGSFDGVHEGHQVILSKVVAKAKEVNGESILITFDPHPRKIIYPDQPLSLLTAPQDKMDLILRLGIDHIVVVPFTRDFSILSAKEYVSEFLVKKFNPNTIVLGYDHHFGHSREGNIHSLRNWTPKEIYIEEIPAQLIKDAAVSSTKIRNAILEGKIENAEEMLGRPFSFEATVVHGQKLGRKLGFPTANLKLNFDDMILPKTGVYGVWMECNENKWKGMLNIGYRPTVSQDKKISIEMHILDFDKEIYGKSIRVTFVKKVREEQKFTSKEQLVEQLKNDELKVREILE